MDHRQSQIHESPIAYDARPPVASSNRAFGVVLGAALIVLPLLIGFPVPLAWAVVGLGAALLALGLALPRALWIANLLWTRLGTLLGRVSQFTILSVVFYGVIVPSRGIALLSGTVRIKTRIDPEAGSYWEEPGAEAEPDLERQF